MTESISQKTDRELCRIIATSISDIAGGSLNPTFRQNYFDVIKVTNSTDAQNSLENRLLCLIGETENTLREKNSIENNRPDKSSLEDYIALKILCPSDAINNRKYTHMVSLIKYLMQIDPNTNEQMVHHNNSVSTTDILPCNILDCVESIQMEL